MRVRLESESALDDFAGIRTAFSLGIGPNVDWDHDVAERGIEVWQFDHTVTGPPRQHRLFRFNKRRIDGVASVEAEDLASLLAKHGSSDPFSNLLKVDIEGSEWDLFGQADDAVLGSFPQIVCEFHGLAEVHDDGHYRRMIGALTRLRRTFEVVHVHGNNVGGRVFAADQALPNVLEVTFAHNGRYTFGDEIGSFPTALDRRCDPSRPDYDLGDFAFGASPWKGLVSLASRTRDDVRFDGDAYRAANPDLDIPGEEAWSHWRLWGWREARPLSPDESGFDPDAYLAANPDVAAAGFDALIHWRHFGRREGRRTTRITDAP